MPITIPKKEVPTPPEEDISQIAFKLCWRNNELKTLKTTVDTLKRKFKDLVKNQEQKSFETDMIKVEVTEVASSSLDETLLLEKLKELGFTKAIATKEYVNMEVLEKALYNEEIKADDLVGCYNTSVTDRLTTKIKKGYSVEDVQEHILRDLGGVEDGKA